MRSTGSALQSAADEVVVTDRGARQGCVLGSLIFCIAYEKELRDVREAGRNADLWPRMHQPSSYAPWRFAEGPRQDSASAPDIVGTEVAEVTYVDDYMTMVSDEDRLQGVGENSSSTRNVDGDDGDHAKTRAGRQPQGGQDGGDTGTQGETSARIATSPVRRRRAETHVGFRVGAHRIKVVGLHRHLGTMRDSEQTTVLDASWRRKVHCKQSFRLRTESAVFKTSK